MSVFSHDLHPASQSEAVASVLRHHADELPLKAIAHAAGVGITTAHRWRAGEGLEPRVGELTAMLKKLPEEQADDLLASVLAGTRYAVAKRAAELRDSDGDGRITMRDALHVAVGRGRQEVLECVHRAYQDNHLTRDERTAIFNALNAERREIECIGAIVGARQ